MPDDKSMWVGQLEVGGIPVPVRPGHPPPAGWRLEDVTAAERPRSLAIGPDRSWLAFILDRGDGSDVWRIGVDGGMPERLTTDRGPAPYWEDTPPTVAPDGRSVAYAHSGASWVVPADGGVARQLVDVGSPVWLGADRLVAAADRDECSRLVVLDVEDPWPARLVRSGPTRSEPGDEGEAAASPNGRRVAFTFSPRADLSAGRVCVVDVDTGEGSELAGVAGYRDHGPAWAPDSSTVAYLSERTGRHQVRLIGADGKGDRALTDEDADFGSLAWAPDGARIAATRTNAGRSALVVIDVSTGAVTELAAGGVWSEPAWTAAGDLVAGYESQSVPPELRRVPVPGGEATTLLAPAPAGAKRAPHVIPTEVWYPSFDGRPIPGFLFRPAAADDGPVPAVVYPHGGPTSVYGDDWDGHAQYFVAKGYAWFAINFRGSTTYGLDHERANHGVWGVDDTGDCLAAHDFLGRQGWVDPARIAIFGASYGSYLALLSITDDPDHRYACAVAKYGDCDILTSWAQSDRDGRIDLERMMGHPSQARDAYRAGSPVHRLDNLQRPILIAHGARNERVSPAQSEELVAALRARQATFEYVTYPTEGHGLLRTEPQLDFYRRLERFLDWYLL